MIRKIYNWLYPEQKAVSGKCQYIDAGKIDTNFWARSIIFTPPIRKGMASSWYLMAELSEYYEKDGRTLRSNSRSYQIELLSEEIGTVVCLFLDGQLRVSEFPNILTDREVWNEIKTLSS